MGKPQEIEVEVTGQAEEAGPGWGRYLRHEREARSLTVEDVAKETLLEPKLILALEAEDYDALPASSFVKGYVRSYARFLEIDAEPLLKTFSSVCGEDLPRFNTVLKNREASSNDRAPRYLTIGLVAVVVISAIFWWWSKVLGPATVDSSVIADSEAVISEVIETLVVEPEILADVPAPIEPESVESEPQATVEEVAAVEPEPTPVAAVDTLVITFNEDCWTEVHDADGERLYLDLGRAGNSKTVSGKTPFNILLGNAAGVSLEFNGAAYDHGQHIKRSGSARFSLGE